jgi:hypothetical protein
MLNRVAHPKGFEDEEPRRGNRGRGLHAAGTRSANVQLLGRSGLNVLMVLFHTAMADRLRHCLECPECGTRYVIGFSPYRNGSYLISYVTEATEEYVLFCFCRRPPVCSRWNGSGLKRYSVSNGAYYRGYGSPLEVWLFRHYATPKPGFLNADRTEKEPNRSE